MAIIGIDFGSSFSTVSWINPLSNKPEAVKFNGDGSVKMPSLIFFTQDGFHYGFQAAEYFDEISVLPQEQRMEYLPNFIPGLKRRLLNESDTEWFFGKPYSHRQLLQLFLEHIIEQAKQHCGIDYHIDRVVISHPVDFPKVSLLRDALSALGFNDVQTEFEPVSAVKGYGLDHEIRDNDGILVFDFGGGTIDVAFVQKRFGDLIVVTEPRGNSNCGGQDIDLAIYENLRKQLKNEFSIDISPNGGINQVLLSACRRLKEKFSGGYDSYETNVLLPIHGRLQTYKYRLNRDSFNSIIYPIVSKAINVADLVIREVKEKGIEISKILLIGGSSQLTLIRERLASLVGLETTIETCGEKDIVVALGNIADQIDSFYISPHNQEEEVLWAYPTEEPLNEKRAISCIKCGSRNCFHFVSRIGYHCLDCGWEGSNVILTYNNLL